MGHYEKQGLRRAIAAAPLDLPDQEALAYESRFAANRAHGHHWMLVGWCAAGQLASSRLRSATSFFSRVFSELLALLRLAHIHATELRSPGVDRVLGYAKFPVLHLLQCGDDLRFHFPFLSSEIIRTSRSQSVAIRCRTAVAGRLPCALFLRYHYGTAVITAEAESR